MQNPKASHDFYVYAHRRKDSGDIFYIGKGSGRRAYTESGRSEFWQRVSRKHGFTVEILKSGLTEGQAFREEISAIYAHENLCNMTAGGEGISGYNHTVETREKLRAAHSGRKQDPEVVRKRTEKLKGKKRTPEFSMAVRERSTGRKASPETREKMSAARKGRVASRESVEKTAAAHRGAKRSKDARDRMSRGHSDRARKVACEDLGISFSSLEKAAEWVRDSNPKATRTGVWLAASGRYKRSYGYRWSFIDV